MSFTTSIYGNAPPNTFVYTTTTVSVNSISVENLSATNASIANLTTTLFSPVNVNASNVVAKTINSSTGNFSTATANNFIGTTATIQTANNTYLNSSLASISTINTSLINVSDVSASGIGCVFIAANEAYIDEAVGTNISYDSVSCNSLTATNGTINNNLDVNGTITISGLTTANTIIAIDVLSNNVSAPNISATTKLTAPNISTTNISCTTLTASGNIKGNLSQNLAAGAGIQLSTTAGITTITNTGLVTSPLSVSIINSSTLNSSIGNIKTINSSTGNISICNVCALIASSVDSPNGTIGLLRVETLTNGTINSSVAVNASTGNISVMNSCSIIATGVITGQRVVSTTLKSDISENLVAGTGIALSTLAGVTTITNTITGVSSPLNVSVINNSLINTSNVSAINILCLTGGFNLLSATTSNISNSNSSNSNASIINASTINGSTITGNIGGNLIAGEGIELSTLSGLTTISNTGGLATSTQYAFQVTSSSGGNVSYSAGGVLNFNLVQLCIPSTANYNTTNKSYVVQVAGYYQFGFKLYLNSTTTTVARFGIYKNSVLLGMGGAYLANAETITIVALCNPGDLINVKCEVGTNISIYMAQYHTWFYGYLLQPKNNTIDTTTNLLLNSLNATTSIYSPSGIIDTLSTGTHNSSTINSSIIINSLATITTLNTTTISNSGTITSNVGNIDDVISSNIDTTNLSAITANISTINNSTFNSSTINTSTLTTNGMTSTDLINGTDIILSSTLEVAGGVIAYQLRGDSLRIRSSNPVTYSDAIVNKFNNTLNIAGGSGLDPGTIQFSTNGINYDMVYDGNLNLINALNAGIVNAGFLNGNLSNNLDAGTNITLSTSLGGITTMSTSDTATFTTITVDNISADVDITSPVATINQLTSTNITSDNGNIGILTASVFNFTPNFFYASYASTLPLSGTIFTFAPGTITTNSGFTNSSGVVTVADAAYYRISAQINYQNNTTLRMSGELASAINGTEQLSYPKGYSYARGSNEGRYVSSAISDWVVFLNGGQNVRFYFTVALGTSTSFTGTLVGINSLPGGYISITRIS